MPMLLPESGPCYFCDILAAGARHWSVLEHTGLTMTMLNGRQYEVGQCIVTPVRHAPTLLDLTDSEAAAVLAAARRAARVLVAALDPDGILLYQNNGSGAGQEVPHFHLHVVPRRPGSDWGFGPPHIARLEQRPAHLDHAVVTDAKRDTARLLQRQFARGVPGDG